jgi:hypothetical protein
MKNPIFLVVGVVAVLVVVALYLFNNSESVADVDVVQTEQRENPATFTWRFTDSSIDNLDGLPQTDIFLSVTYGTQTVEGLVDTVDGGCSQLDGERYDGDISAVGRVQCYAAGFGQQYRVTQSSDVFFVERKFFEEAMPEIAPPVYEWEVVSEFSFM